MPIPCPGLCARDCGVRGPEHHLESDMLPIQLFLGETVVLFQIFSICPVLSAACPVPRSGGDQLGTLSSAAETMFRILLL